MSTEPADGSDLMIVIIVSVGRIDVKFNGIFAFYTGCFPVGMASVP